MDKKEFIKVNLISTRTPEKIQKHIYSTKAFAVAIKDFIEENFAALAEVKDDVDSNMSILISADFAAEFFKRLLTDIYGRIFLKIHIYTDEKKLRLIITSDSPFPLEYDETNDLIRTVRNAGFEVYPHDNGFSLAAPLSKEAALSVYAIPIRDGVIILKRKFNEMFYFGCWDNDK